MGLLIFGIFSFLFPILVNRVKRAFVVRSCFKTYSALLADEPTGNLDTRTGEEILSTFEDLHQQGQTVLVVPHAEDVAQRTLRVVRLRDSRIESDAPP